LRLSGTIHDLQPIELGAFSEAQARDFLILRGEFHRWNLSSETIDAILEAVEWHIPFYLNLVFEELRAVVKEVGGVPAPGLADAAVGRLIAHGRTHFDHWDERLRKLLDPGFPEHCEIVLSLASREAHGVRIATIDLRLSQTVREDAERAQVIRHLLDFLTGDGYLVRRGDSVHFRSALLRRYWKEVQG
jgi:hypothetical protein